jgi:2-amino-4-hydroxy-6-hydroxymethyldihydropteridine diphosphokinase
MNYPVYILMGSNILPGENIRAAYGLLAKQVQIVAWSSVWETPAVGSTGPNFLNLALELSTSLRPDELKHQTLRPLETQLGRVRTSDKNAPRTIDLDILIYDRIIMETNIWSLAHIACPLADLLPDLRQPNNNLTLYQVAAMLQAQTPVRVRGDIRLEKVVSK